MGTLLYSVYRAQGLTSWSSKSEGQDTGAKVAAWVLHFGGNGDKDMESYRKLLLFLGMPRMGEKGGRKGTRTGLFMIPAGFDQWGFPDQTRNGELNCTTVNQGKLEEGGRNTIVVRK